MFIAVDSMAEIPEISPTWREVDRSGGIRCFAMRSTAPAFCKPRLQISTTATVTVAGWPNPLKASANGTAPITVAASSATKATTS